MERSAEVTDDHRTRARRMFGAMFDDLAQMLANEEAERKELQRMRRDYSIFEELAPPDVPRYTFAQWCFDAWEKTHEE